MYRNTRLLLVALFLVIVPSTGADSVLVDGKSAQREDVGENVTLRFEIRGVGDEFVVVTARQNYTISSSGSNTEEHGAQATSRDDKNSSAESGASADNSETIHKQEEHHVELTGTVERGSNSDKMLVSCMGAIHVARVEEHNSSGEQILKSDEIVLEIDASALVELGEKTLLVQAGKHALHVTVYADK